MCTLLMFTKILLLTIVIQTNTEDNSEFNLNKIREVLA